MSRDHMVEPGGIASSPDGKLWCVLSVDDNKIVLRSVDDERVLLGKMRGGKRIEISWQEWSRGWEQKFP